MKGLISFAAVAALATTPALALQEEEAQADTGYFAGSYTCQDGEHGIYLELDLDANDGEVAQVSGVLSFFPTIAGKDGPVGMVNGSFAVSGTITRSTMAISLEPGEWLLQPDGYGAAALEGTFTETQEGLSQIIGKPVVPGNPDFCSDLIVTELVRDRSQMMTEE
jgi:hypothetical protein